MTVAFDDFSRRSGPPGNDAELKALDSSG